MICNSEVSFCVDTLLVEAILGEPKLHKTAGFVQDLLGRVKDYFMSKIDPSNPTASVLKELAPGALWLLFNSLGIGKWGMLLGLLMEVFHIDAFGMLKSLYEKVKGMISGGDKVSSEQIDSAAQSTAQEFSQPGNEQEAQQGYKALQQKSKEQEQAQANDGKVYSSLELLDDAKMFSMALISYEHEKLRLVKEADFGSFFGGYGRSKAKGGSLLASIFGWVIKLALASAGLMVAGDVVNSLLGRSNSFDGSYQGGKESPSGASSSAPSGPKSTQTKFPAKGDSSLPRSWPLVNNPTNIENMLVEFAQDTYSGLEGKDSLIRSSPAFQAVKETINWFNIHNEGSAVIFLPKQFTSKKNVVDYFIDDVAKRTP